MISAFLAFHLFAIISWCIPLDTPLIVSFRSMVVPYMAWSGLFQKWDMFAPNPSMLNNYMTADITYADGHTATWSFPRMEELGLVQKYVKERYRKFANDNLRLDAFSVLWPDAARYIARVNKLQPSNPPVAIDLVRHWSVVPPPTFENGFMTGPWNHFRFFHYVVQPGDLQ